MLINTGTMMLINTGTMMLIKTGTMMLINTGTMMLINTGTMMLINFLSQTLCWVGSTCEEYHFGYIYPIHATCDFIDSNATQMSVDV